MDILFIMDPIEQVNVDTDTTFALMIAAQKRGHTIFTTTLNQLRIYNGEPATTARKITVQASHQNHFSEVSKIQQNLRNYDVIFMRTDPPFNIHYLHAVHILDLAKEQGVLVINDPTGLRIANEKLYPLHFHSLMPKTWIISNKLDIFVTVQLLGQCIMKPVDGHGGEGIFLLKNNDSNLLPLIDLATKNGTERVVIQQFVPEASKGDKRILLVDGEPLGAILRVPQKGQHIGNLHAGGSAAPTTLTRKDLEICQTLKPKLKKDGLFFVGIDILGNFMTEINVTSPTGIQEMSQFDNIDYPSKVIEKVEQKRSIN